MTIKKIVYPLLFCLAVRAWALPTTVYREQAVPGTPLVVAMKGNSALANVRVALLDRNGLFITGGRAYSYAKDADVFLCILGIADFLPPGPYEIEVEGQDGLNFFWQRKPVTLLKRDFDSEDIVFGSAMTDLRNEDEKKRTEEYAALTALLRSFNPTAQYHDGAFSYPLEQLRQTAGFGDRRNYLYTDGYRASSTHAGIDYGGAKGTEVYASGAGKIVMARHRIISGNTVVIQHMPAVFSLYYHLDSIDVSEGDMVGMGDIVGKVGATGLATGPHLHWEFRAAGVAVDPLWFVQNGPLDTIENLGNID